METISSTKDLIPLLFSHSTYKTYPTYRHAGKMGTDVEVARHSVGL